MKKAPDWTKTGTVEGYAKYLAKQSGALCVLVIRPHDSVFAVDPKCPPSDAGELVAEYLPWLVSRVVHERKTARLNLERVPE